MILGVGVLHAADTVVYQSNFENGMQGWVGREGVNGVRPALSTDVVEARGKTPYCEVESNGKLGCGLTLKPSVEVEKGKEYLLSFWLRTSNPILITYRITDEKGQSYGEDNPHWHNAPKSQGEWVQVEYAFAATASTIGLEIAAGTETQEISKIAIDGVVLTKTSD